MPLNGWRIYTGPRHCYPHKLLPLWTFQAIFTLYGTWSDCMDRLMLFAFLRHVVVAEAIWSNQDVGLQLSNRRNDMRCVDLSNRNAVEMVRLNEERCENESVSSVGLSFDTLNARPIRQFFPNFGRSLEMQPIFQLAIFSAEFRMT